MMDTPRNGSPASGGLALRGPREKDSSIPEARALAATYRNPPSGGAKLLSEMMQAAVDALDGKSIPQEASR